MAPFSPDHVRRALLRLPAMDSKGLQTLRDRAQARGLADLSEACEAELALRGAVILDRTAAERHAAWAGQVDARPLRETVEIAFSVVPPQDDERPVIGWIAQMPGISHARLSALRGKGDVALILGHLVYDRFGFFRRFAAAERPMSDVLLARSKGEGGMTYRLRDEALSAFRALSVV